MIATSQEAIRDPRKYCSSIVKNLRCLAMHQFRRTHNVASKYLTYDLVSQANAKDRNATGKPFHHIERYAGIARGSRSWGNYDSFWFEFAFYFRRRGFFISTYFHFLA